MSDEWWKEGWLSFTLHFRGLKMQILVTQNIGNDLWFIQSLFYCYSIVCFGGKGPPNLIQFWVDVRERKPPDIKRVRNYCSAPSIWKNIYVENDVGHALPAHIIMNVTNVLECLIQLNQEKHFQLRCTTCLYTDIRLSRVWVVAELKHYILNEKNLFIGFQARVWQGIPHIYTALRVWKFARVFYRTNYNEYNKFLR